MFISSHEIEYSFSNKALFIQQATVEEELVDYGIIPNTVMTVSDYDSSKSDQYRHQGLVVLTILIYIDDA
jgi:hypothetical protein